MKVLTAADLLRRLADDVLLATSGPRDLPERQQTMNATVGWSYQLLDPEEQRAFRCFGALPGLFPIDAAAEVLAGRNAASREMDRALSAIAHLIDKSLLLRAETSVVATCPLYYMLETVRAYAAAELAAAGERDDALEGLVRYCGAEAALANDGLVGVAQIEWLDRVREDLDSYRMALQWLIEQNRAAEASDIACALLFFWLIRGHATEGLRWYEQILSLPRLPPAAEARTLLGAAAMSHTQGDLARARNRLTGASELARDAGDSAAVAQAAWMFGHVEFAAGNLDAAREWFTRSRQAFQPLAIPWGIGSASSGLAWVALATGDEREADRLVNDAISALASAGPWFLALGLYIRAVLALRRRDHDEVIALMRRSLTRVRESQDKFAVLYGLVPLAVAAAHKGDDAWVARILGARAAISERTGSILIDPFLHELCERTEREARARLGADRWAQGHAAGRKSSIDAMLKDILEYSKASED
jgi:non-specific serine/threonine protein kinase